MLLWEYKEDLCGGEMKMVWGEEVMHFIVKQIFPKTCGPNYICLQGTGFIYKDTNMLKVKDGKRYSMVILLKRRLQWLTFTQSKC